MNRGSTPADRAAIEDAMRFNEAPIHESGKWPKLPTCTTETRSCFNEAPIHESGKWALSMRDKDTRKVLQ